MKRIPAFGAFLALAWLLSGCGQLGGVCDECATPASPDAGTAVEEVRTIPEGLRVVGYMPTYYGQIAPRATAQLLSRVTHVHVAFPSVDGGALHFDDPNDVKSFVTAAHERDVKVLVALGGAAGSAQIAAELVPGTLPTFVQQILAMVDQTGFDGVDLDIEGDSVNENFALLVSALAPELEARGKLLSAAVANWFARRISDSTLAEFDYVTVMAYDECGSWTEPCAHSTLELATDNLQFWTQTRGVPAPRTVLGVPFYGYSWGPSGSTVLPYAEIISRYPNAWQADWIDDGVNQVSYNGEATITSKVALGSQYGGVMIWELGGDTWGERSLLRVVSDAF